MAIVYQITEAEMHALLDSLELTNLREPQIPRADYDKPATLKDVHGIFHLKVCRWATDMGFSTGNRR